MHIFFISNVSKFFNINKQFSNTNKQFFITNLKTIFLSALLSYSAVYSSFTYSATSSSIVTDGSTDTKVEAARNGVTVVDIAKPTAGGVSVNNYSDFNVSKSGAVFNNTDVAGVSQLAGAVLGNQNFDKGAAHAKVILNQVTGNGGSDLLGYLEVNGTAAEMIVANPNGIYCNGCGFINTTGAQLITGVAELDNNHNIKGYNLSKQAQITIGNQGLNASGSEVLDLITRGIKLDGKITANKLYAYLGNAYYDYQTKTISSDDAIEPAGFSYAIDSTTLGGLYANQIQIIGTEKGLGVNNDGEIISYLEDVNIDVNGTVVLNNVASKQNTIINSHQYDTNIQTLTTGNDANFNANNLTLTTATINHNLSVNTQDTTNFNQEVFINNNTTINTKNFNNQNIAYIAADFNINATGDVTNNGTLSVQKTLQLNANNLINNKDIRVSGNLTANIQQDINNIGKIMTMGDLNLIANNIYNTKDTDKYSNGGLIFSKTNLNLYAANNIINNRALIYALQDLTIASKQAYSNPDLEITDINKQAQKLENISGKIESGKDMNIFAKDVVNRASLEVYRNNYNYYHESYKKGDGWYEDKFVEWTDEVHEDYQSANILSGNTLFIKSENQVLNRVSNIIAQNDIQIESGIFQNIAIKLLKTKRYTWGDYDSFKCGVDSGGVKYCRVYFDRPDVKVVQYDSISSKVSSGGNITINAKRGIENGTVEKDAKVTGLNHSTPEDTDKPVDDDDKPIDFSKNPLASVNEDIFNPDKKCDPCYLIESDPFLSSVDNLLGSEYFFDKIGVDPELPFLGDAAYEQELIKKQMQTVATDSYLGTDAKDMNELMKVLYNNTAEFVANQSDLNLTPGIALTKEQIKNLKQDIVWYEKQTVTLPNGKTIEVLAPKLYLSTLTLDNVDTSTGAVISGSNVTLKTTGSYDKTTTQDELSTIDNAFDELLKDDFTWSTTKVTEDKPRLVTYPDGSSKLRRLVKKVSKPSKSLQDALDLDLNTSLTLNKPFPKKLQQLAQKLPEAMMNAFEAKVDQMRSKALNQAKTELLKALSLKNHWNPNKLSKAQQQELTLRANILADKYAQKAQIIFLTTLSKRGSITNRQGTIKARNKLLIDSDNNIINQGGSFESGGDTVLIAKNDVSVYTNYYQTTGANGDNIYGAIGKQSKLSSGGKLSIQAGNNVNFVGANVSSQGDTSIEADNSFNISSIAINNKRTSFENRSDEYVTTVEQSTKQHKTNLKSGGNFSVRTGGAVNIQGADISAEQAIDIDATQGINSIAVYDTYSKKVTIEEKSKGGLAGIASSIVGGTNTTTQATDKGNANSNQLTSKHATVTLKSEQDINLEATNIKAEQDIKITSTQGKVALLSAKNWDSYSEETKGEGLLWKTDKGKGHSKQTFTANQFTTNKGTTDIDAKETIELDIEKQQVEYQVEEQYQTTETYTEPDCTFFCTKTRTVTKTRTITKQRDETDEEAINRLIKTDPGKAWMATLISNKNKNKLTTNQITSINKDWDYNNSGLTDAAQLALTIAVSSFTGGLGSGISGAMASAGAGSFVSTVSITSINTLGQGEALSDAIHKGLTTVNPEAIAMSMLSAGITQGANSLIEKYDLGVNIGNDTTLIKKYGKNWYKNSQWYTDSLVSAGIRGTAQGINSTIFGKDFEDGFRFGAYSSFAYDHYKSATVDNDHPNGTEPTMDPASEKAGTKPEGGYYDKKDNVGSSWHIDKDGKYIMNDTGKSYDTLDELPRSAEGKPFLSHCARFVLGCNSMAKMHDNWDFTGWQNKATIPLAWIINSWAWTSTNLGANLYHRGWYNPSTYGGQTNMLNW